jgi:4-hydroxybutyrate dehydrogenase
MTEDQVATFAKSTIENQQRLLGNNYVPLTEEEIAEIFQSLY